MKIIGVLVIIGVLCAFIFGALGIGARGNKKADDAKKNQQ